MKSLLLPTLILMLAVGQAGCTTTNASSSIIPQTKTDTDRPFAKDSLTIMYDYKNKDDVLKMLKDLKTDITYSTKSQRVPILIIRFSPNEFEHIETTLKNSPLISSVSRNAPSK